MTHLLRIDHDQNGVVTFETTINESVYGGDWYVLQIDHAARRMRRSKNYYRTSEIASAAAYGVRTTWTKWEPIKP